MAKNFAEVRVQLFLNGFHCADKCADVLLVKTGWVFESGKLLSELPDFFLSSLLKLISLKWDLFRDLVIVNTSAVERHHQAQEHEN